MTANTWKRLKALSCHVPGLDLLVDLSMTGLPDDALVADPLVNGSFPAAFRAMADLEAGAIANPDEGRRVGHYWLRAPELSPDAETREAIEGTLRKVTGFSARVRAGEVRPPSSERFRSFLVVGIGGSALGPQLVADALGSPQDALKPYFLDNTDPDGIARELARIDAATGLAANLVIVISKSGGTKETRNGMLEAAAAYRGRGLDFGAHAVAVTQEGSELDRVASRDGFLERFPMWDWVGGRTSELSAVGLLPAALQGLDVAGLLEGARLCDEATRVPDVGKNPAALLALAWYRETDGRGAKDMVVLPYKDRLLLLSRYLQQLVMESLGKEKDLSGKVVEQGIAVYGNKGSTDQHAFVQQLRDGVPNFFVTFLHVLGERGDGAPPLEVEPGVTSGDYLLGFLLGTRAALAEKGRPSVTITVPDVSARSLGALVALFERTVGLYASLVGINAYHQPGVEAGKKAATRVLSLEARVAAELARLPGTFRTAEEVAAAIGAAEETETVFRLLEHLGRNPGRHVARQEGASLFSARYAATS